MNEPIHVLCYGESGAGKSTFAATFPTPMLVLMWDPLNKEMPYLNRGRPQPPQMRQGIRYREVQARKSEKTIIRIEHFLNATPDRPDAFEVFQTRLRRLTDEVGMWKTVVWDSTTFAEMAARKLHQYRLNASSRDPRQWFAGSTDLLEEALMISLAALPSNVVVICHVDEDKDELYGTFVRNPMAPGRLRKRLASAYGEMYRAYVTRDDHGDRLYALQTRADDRYNASTQINAPDPALPHYRALWSKDKDDAADTEEKEAG